jgi:hypothetical protein
MARPSKMRTKHSRPPRIRVPNNERALFVVDEQKYIGVVHRLSLTGGSTVLAKGPVPEGTIGQMILNTVFGKVEAQVEFMHTGADGKEHAQAFRFLDMNDVSSKRFAAAAKQMEQAGFSDVEIKEDLGELAARGWSKLRESVRQLSSKRKSSS